MSQGTSPRRAHSRVLSRRGPCRRRQDRRLSSHLVEQLRDALAFLEEMVELRVAARDRRGVGTDLGIERAAALLQRVAAKREIRGPAEALPDRIDPGVV